MWSQRCNSLLKRAMFPSDGIGTVVATTGAPAELKGAMFPNGRDRRNSALRAQFPDDPAPRFPPPAHRRCACLGDRVRGQPVENAPCEARHRAGSLSRAFRPLLQRRRVFHASSTTRRSRQTEARWAKGGKRNSAFGWGDVPSTGLGERSLVFRKGRCLPPDGIRPPSRPPASVPIFGWGEVRFRQDRSRAPRFNRPHTCGRPRS